MEKYKRRILTAAVVTVIGSLSWMGYDLYSKGKLGNSASTVAEPETDYTTETETNFTVNAEPISNDPSLDDIVSPSELSDESDVSTQAEARVDDSSMKLSPDILTSGLSSVPDVTSGLVSSDITPKVEPDVFTTQQLGYGVAPINDDDSKEVKFLKQKINLLTNENIRLAKERDAQYAAAKELDRKYGTCVNDAAVAANTCQEGTNRLTAELSQTTAQLYETATQLNGTSTRLTEISAQLSAANAQLQQARDAVPTSGQCGYNSELTDALTATDLSDAEKRKRAFAAIATEVPSIIIPGATCLEALSRVYAIAGGDPRNELVFLVVCSDLCNGTNPNKSYKFTFKGGK